MSDSTEPEGLVSRESIQRLFGDVSRLVQDHVALLRRDMREDLGENSRRLVLILIFSTVGVTGYFMLNLGAVFVVWWLFNVSVAAISALGVALANLAASIIFISHYAKKISSDEYLSNSKKELERSREWLATLPKTSSKDD